MSQKTVKVNFTGLSIRNEFNPNDNSILDILKKHYDVQVCDDPDYLFCGVLYKGYFNQGVYDKYILSDSKIRIMFDGENLVPDFNLVDYAVCQYPMEYFDRNCYFPCGIEAFTNRRTFFRELQDKDRNYSEEFLKSKEFFASFIASHDSENNMRGDFFKALNKRKRVESVGSYLNNMPNGETVDWLDGSKLKFQRKCKFSLCFESTKDEGFITEKIIEAFYSDTIPVYYGSSNITDIFNPKAFINVGDYESIDAVIDRILEIDSNDALYLEMMRQPIFNNPNYPQEKYEELERFICNIFDQPIDKACRRSRCVAGENYEAFMKRSIESELGIKVWRPAGKIVKNYLRNIPKRILKKTANKDS